MEPRYDHKQIEEKIYSLWEKSGYFNPDNRPESFVLSPKSSFCIIMPPPNANGSLHIGHALFVTLEDIMIRFARMQGKKTLWLPGADHAGFETQTVYDKKLEKEGRNRFQIPREELYKEMYAFTQENKKLMEHQLRKLGASCDWSREKFTLDPDIVEEVQKTFIKMHKDGLIYRGLRTVNWCVKHQTALSDLEVKYVEQKDPLYYMKYGPFTLATVRPETKFGDTAIAVNPKDSRYKKYVGKEIEVEGLLGKFKIKVIADKAVDPEFGTGVIKVTPAHDPVDFEISQRHNLEIKQVIDRYGKLNEKTGPYQGLKVDEARKKVAEDLKQKGLLVKVEEDYTHSIATCYRCGRQLEPLPLPQWFIKMEPLAKKGIEVIQKGKIKFHPPRFKKIYLDWLKNLRDWNISRQIIWGIRIPAWFKEEKIHVGEKSPKEKGWTQDPDVFDTWFSSAQWPYLTLGWKDSGKHKKDFKDFYPTSVMETAADILFFWVARMIMLGIYRTGKVPFKTVYLHGLILDKDKQKMSKSRGNVIDPLGVAAEYGTDAVRMALIAGNTPGRNSAISEDKIRGYRNFATKLWNIARFISLKSPELVEGLPKNPKLTAKDKKYLKQLEATKKNVTRHLEKFEFHRAAELTYHYIWHTFADKIIEEAKPRLQNEKEKAAATETLTAMFTECLKMLHPFMPFVTEEIFQHLQELQGKKKKTLLMIEPW
ncbi:MAG: valine--tRNA ligase [bacterium]|nr:valine--tRNA ligase [bacterium]